VKPFTHVISSGIGLFWMALIDVLPVPFGSVVICDDAMNVPKKQNACLTFC
jgi:hypothetical protein